MREHATAHILDYYDARKQHLAATCPRKIPRKRIARCQCDYDCSPEMINVDRMTEKYFGLTFGYSEWAYAQ